MAERVVERERIYAGGERELAVKRAEGDGWGP